jgi:hypothetical protein
MLKIIVKECHNNKTNILCCFLDFRKTFDIVPRTNLWNILEEIKIPFELRAIVISLYENVLAAIFHFYPILISCLHKCFGTLDFHRNL